MKPAGYDSPIVEYDTHVQMAQDAYDSGFSAAVKKVIEILHRRQEEREQLQDKGDWDNGYLCALEAVECEVMVMEGTE